MVEKGRKTLGKKKKKGVEKNGWEIVVVEGLPGELVSPKTRASDAFNIYESSLLTPTVTICTNKTDGGQRCRRITSGHLSLCGNSLLNK